MSSTIPGLIQQADLLLDIDSDFSILDLNDPAHIESFEKAFYAAFVNLHSNQLVRKIWDWDVENERLKTRVEYSDQIIFAWRNRVQEIKCSAAVNINNSVSQFGNYGFKVPENKEGKYYEVLTLFTLNLDRANGIRLDRYFLKAFCISYMQKLGYDFMVSTCATRPLSTYLRWGWEILDEATIDNEKRYFLYYDIHKNLQ